jgi:hypothetical protein
MHNGHIHRPGSFVRWLLFFIFIRWEFHAFKYRRGMFLLPVSRKFWVVLHLAFLAWRFASCPRFVRFGVVSC